MARLISCPLAFRFAFCFFTALLTLARELAMLGSWNKLLVSDTFCSSNARNWSHCGQYVNTTLHMIPERSIHTSTNQVFLIQLLLLSRTIWSGILLEEETYQVWRTQATPSVLWDKRHAASPCAIPHNQMEVDTAKFIKTQNLYRLQTSKWVNNSYQKTRLSYQHWINTHSTK